MALAVITISRLSLLVFAVACVTQCGAFNNEATRLLLASSPPQHPAAQSFGGGSPMERLYYGGNLPTQWTARLAIPPRFMWGWGPGLSGFCGSCSIQSAALYFGSWISQEYVRYAAGDKEILLGRNVADAAKVFQLLVERYPYEEHVEPQAPNFIQWGAQHLMASHPVISGWYEKLPDGYGDDDYDHIIPLIGFVSAEAGSSASVASSWSYTGSSSSGASQGDASSGGMSTLYFNDLWGNETRSKEAPVDATRKAWQQKNEAKQPLDYALPKEVDYGGAVIGFYGVRSLQFQGTTESVEQLKRRGAYLLANGTGVDDAQVLHVVGTPKGRDLEGERTGSASGSGSGDDLAYRMVLTASDWTEPDYSPNDHRNGVPNNISFTATVYGLQLGDVFTVLRFDGNASIPAGNFSQYLSLVPQPGGKFFREDAGAHVWRSANFLVTTENAFQLPPLAVTGEVTFAVIIENLDTVCTRGVYSYRAVLVSSTSTTTTTSATPTPTPTTTTTTTTVTVTIPPTTSTTTTTAPPTTTTAVPPWPSTTTPTTTTTEVSTSSSPMTTTGTTTTATEPPAPARSGTSEAPTAPPVTALPSASGTWTSSATTVPSSSSTTTTSAPSSPDAAGKEFSMSTFITAIVATFFGTIVFVVVARKGIQLWRGNEGRIAPDHTSGARSLGEGGTLQRDSGGSSLSSNALGVAAGANRSLSQVAGGAESSPLLRPV